MFLVSETLWVFDFVRCLGGLEDGGIFGRRSADFGPVG